MKPDASVPFQTAIARVSLIDFSRGVALIAMTVFHFCWDLELFRILPVGTMAGPVAIHSAHLIAGTFLVLVGVSLALAHRNEIRWRPFWRRWLMVAGAAALITLATWFAFPEAFIFFGILHSIAVGSILALAFLRLPVWLTALTGVATILLGAYWYTPALDDPWWWWTGLSEFIPTSNDYVPLFPYFGPVLLGVALGRWAIDKGAMARLAHVEIDAPPARGLRFIGRHSLAYYLLHQPAMLAILFIFLKLIGHI